VTPEKVAHSVVSLVVQLRIAAKHDAGLVVEQHVEVLPPAYASLRQACEESTERQLSRNVEPNVTGLLGFLNELTIHLKRYLSKFETDELEDEDCEADFGPEPPLGLRWRKVLHVGEELRQLLRSFMDRADETSNGGWYAEDFPF